MPKTPHEVLEFWFSDQMRPYWFAKSDDIDRDIAARFSDTYEAAHAGRLDDWMDAPDSALDSRVDSMSCGVGTVGGVVSWAASRPRAAEGTV